MNLEEQNQNDNQTFNFDKIDHTSQKENGNVSANVKKKNCPFKKDSSKDHKCKFTPIIKLIFWSLMLLLVLILGAESFVQAIGKIDDIQNYNVNADKDQPTKALLIFQDIILWIEALFYIIVFSWSFYGTTKNAIVVSKIRKEKKLAKEESPKNKDAKPKNKDAKSKKQESK